VQQSRHSPGASGLTISRARLAIPGYQRPLDLIVALGLLVLTLPVWVLTAILVKLTSRGPVLYRQERIGLDGEPFIMYKFRTMRDGVDATLHANYIREYMQGKPAADQSGEIFKLRRDPRITPLGGLLRRLGIDELPQLINVVRGEMSMVGPRPPLAYEVELYTPRHRQRLTAKPGITGLWQVHGRDIVDFETMVDMDLRYIAQQSFRGDVTLLILTAPMIALSMVRSAAARSHRHPPTT
jgi:lipopolysaccharide/colanic/teichoic acid biosynthesis glycosyltransferase